jgi:hypothetical protein
MPKPPPDDLDDLFVSLFGPRAAPTPPPLNPFWPALWAAFRQSDQTLPDLWRRDDLDWPPGWDAPVREVWARCAQVQAALQDAVPSVEGAPDDGRRAATLAALLREHGVSAEVFEKHTHPPGWSPFAADPPPAG